MYDFVKTTFLMLLTFYIGCATTSQKGSDNQPVVNIKKIKIENTTRFETPEELQEFIKSTPEYSGAKLLANDLLGDAEIRKRFENYGYMPYARGDLNRDGKDEYIFVIINQNIPTLLIIKKTIEDQWKEDFSLKLNTYAQIKLIEPSVGIFGNECIIVTNINLKAIYNICWDGMKYLVVDF